MLPKSNFERSKLHRNGNSSTFEFMIAPTRFDRGRGSKPGGLERTVTKCSRHPSPPEPRIPRSKNHIKLRSNSDSTSTSKSDSDNDNNHNNNNHIKNDDNRNNNEHNDNNDNVNNTAATKATRATPRITTNSEIKKFDSGNHHDTRRTTAAPTTTAATTTTTMTATTSTKTTPTTTTPTTEKLTDRTVGLNA